MKDFKELVIWQRSIQLTTSIYQLTKLLPKEETYGLISQLRRAAVSVPSNIAEGYGREATAEYIRFLKIARGSLYEIETQLYLCKTLQFFTDEEIMPCLRSVEEVGKMLNTMLRRVSSLPNARQ